MRFSSRQTMLAVVAGLSLAILAGDRLLVTPLIHSWQARQQRCAELQRQTAVGQALLFQQDRLQQIWQDIQTGALPVDASVAESLLLTSVSRMAEESHVKVTAVRPALTQDPGQHRQLELRLSAVGPIAAVSRFIHSLETGALPLLLEEVSLNSGDGKILHLDLLATGVLHGGGSVMLDKNQ